MGIIPPPARFEQERPDVIDCLGEHSLINEWLSSDNTLARILLDTSVQGGSAACRSLVEADGIGQIGQGDTSMLSVQVGNAFTLFRPLLLLMGKSQAQQLNVYAAQEGRAFARCLAVGLRPDS